MSSWTHGSIEARAMHFSSCRRSFNALKLRVVDGLTESLRQFRTRRGEVEQEKRRALEAYYEGLPPGERRSRIILKPEFRDAYNELVQAHRQFPVPEYLWKKWLPVIGPLPVVLYLQLRRYCFYNPETGEKRNICWPKQSTLVKQVGIKDRKTLRKALVVLERHGFIAREHKHYPDPVSGRPHQVADEYSVWFELPLRPEDAAELLSRRMAPGEEKEFSPYGGIFSPHSPEPVDDLAHEGKISPHGGGEKTASRNVTRTITSNVDNVGKPEGREGPFPERMPTTERRARSALALEIGECLKTWAGEKHGEGHPSEGFHRRIASRMPGRLVREALTATRDAVERRRAGQGGCVRGPSAYFAGVVKKLAEKNGIDLGLRKQDGSCEERPRERTSAATARRSRPIEAPSMDNAPMSAEASKAAIKTLLEMIRPK